MLIGVSAQIVKTHVLLLQIVPHEHAAALEAAVPGTSTCLALLSTTRYPFFAFDFFGFSFRFSFVPAVLRSTAIGHARQ